MQTVEAVLLVKINEQSFWQVVYEEIPEAAEIQVGQNTIERLDDGRQSLTAEFLQFSAATATPGTIGTTTAPGDTSAYMAGEVTENDGTLRRIKRTYVYAGTLSQTDEQKNDGKLLLRTVVAIKTEPSTPSGYTRISTAVKSPNGVPVYTYQFAKGYGRISRDTSFKQNGKLKIITIRYLDTDDGTAETGTLVNDDFVEQDGYTLFTKGYAEVQGDGIVTNTSETKAGGKLVLYRITRLGSAPSAPTATIGGTVTATATLVRQEDGFPLYDYQWAEGFGEIERRTEYLDSADAGTTGRTRVTIRHLTATGASDPTSAPSGTVKVSAENTAQDGYLLWTVIYGKGAGTIVSTNELRNGGKLVIYRRVALGAAASDPGATIGGTVTSTEATIRESDGVKVYENTWAEGYGVIGEQTQQRDGGLRLVTRVSLGSAYDASYMKPAGILLAKDGDLLDGYNRYTVTVMQAYDGGADPTSGTMVSIGTKYSFTYPGRAKAFTTSFAAVGFTAYAHDVFLSPPVEVLVDATVQISYQSSATMGTLPYTLWNPDSWATVRAYWEGWNENANSLVQSHLGYRAVGSAVTFTAGTGYASGFDNSCMGNKVYGGSSGAITVSGGPSAPDGNTYTLAASIDPTPAFTAEDGTKYYRRTIVYATIPTQTALPV